MADAFIIEVEDTVAGIIARDGRDYRFYASDHRFSQMEAAVFSSAMRAQAAAKALLDRKPHLVAAAQA